MTSIRLKLIASLLAVLLLAALALGGATYRNALLETQALFDYQLKQMALSLRDQGEIPPGSANAEHDFVVQIWSADGRALYASRAHAAVPTRAVLGFADVEAGGQTWRTYSVATFGRVIQVAQPRQIRERLAADAAWRAVLPLLLLAPLLGLAVWWLVAHALAPLARVSREVRSRDAESLAPLSAEGLPEEVAPLVGSLNALLQRLGAAFDTQRAFVADAAHELRSPLTALKLQVQMLRRAPDEAARAEAVAALAAGVDRATRLVEQLLTLARNEPGSREPARQPLDLGALVRQALADSGTLAVARGSTLELDAQPGVRVRGDSAGLAALARNLADNALRHGPPGTVVKVIVAREGDEAVLSVDDDGPGIPEAERAQAFDRFWRREAAHGGSEAAGGSGLGLAIVRGVVQRHGGTVQLATSPLGGLRVVCRLPALPPSIDEP
ncbi:ATP-binding protein [Aquincola sp. MAHUQ-54]|uniref:histidine kinase n=1 Tax=Aquincola agrisoli TaxID=3119538 RepID=A0AAW9QAV8_9BURK